MTLPVAVISLVLSPTSVQIGTPKRAPEGEKRTFFVPFILPERNFSNICFISIIVYWINFQVIWTFHWLQYIHIWGVTFQSLLVTCCRLLAAHYLLRRLSVICCQFNLHFLQKSLVTCNKNWSPLFAIPTRRSLDIKIN